MRKTHLVVGGIAIAFVVGATFLAIGTTDKSLKIAASANAVRPLHVGDHVPNVSVLQPNGNSAGLRSVLGKAPTVLVFFRGGWSPFCTKHLSGLQEVLPDIEGLGYQVVAISPDGSEATREAVEKYELGYTLLGDPNVAASSAFGLLFALDKKTIWKHQTFGIPLVKAPGTDKVVLPVPAVYLISPEGKITFAYYDADYKVRLEPEKVLKAAEANAEG